MNKSKTSTIDCLLIGHNEVDFKSYVSTIKEMGIHSGAYRDLNLSFLQYQGRPYHAVDIFNWICSHWSFPRKVLSPISQEESFSATIAYLGTYLERRGFTFDYVHSFQAEKQELAEKLSQEDILTIAVTTTYYVSVFPILEVVRFIKRYNRSARVIVGGPFIATQCRTADALTLEFLFQSIGADVYVVSSQGESTLAHILQAFKNQLPLDTVNNLYYKEENQYVPTPVLREENSLSENMVNWGLFSDRVREYVNLRTTISCPFSCAFCGFPEHAGKYQTADINAVEEELDRLKKIETVKSLHFVDDTINVPPKRFKNFLEMLKRVNHPLRWQWHSQIRCQFLDEETVALIKESGCAGVFLGLESRNNSILANMNKNVTVDDYLKGISLLKQYEILSYGSFIIGFPGETYETVKDTIRLIEESKIDFYRTQLWYCELVTPIWKQREKYHLNGSHFEWSHATMNSKEAADLIDNIFLSVKESLWLPQYGFDFNHLFHLLHRGIPLVQIKNFINLFNEGIKEKLLILSASEVSSRVMERLKHVFTSNGKPEETDNSKAKDLIIEFELD